MNTKKLDEIYKTVNDAADAKQAEIESLQTKIEMAEQSISAANDNMTKASDAGDVAAYQAAKADRQNAQDAKEMYTARLEKLTIKAAMSEAEYAQVKKDTEAAAAVIVENDKKKLLDLTDQMQDVKADLEAVAKKADTITHMAFNETYPTSDSKTAAGATPTWYNYRGATDAINWASQAANWNTYKQMKEGR